MKRLEKYIEPTVIAYMLGIFAGLFLSLAMNIKNFVISLFVGLVILLIFNLLLSLFTYKPKKCSFNDKDSVVSVPEKQVQSGKEVSE